ncbi:hypothetical protein MNBD_GAMMA25-1117, partial [hydrothermal vent metagenome]
RICVDCRSPGQGGVLTYTANLVNSLVADAGSDYLLLTDSDTEDWLRHDVEQIRVPSSNPLAWMVWSNAELPALLQKKRIDIYHTLKHVTAFRIPVKSLLTFHGAEMIYRFPKLYKWHDLVYWRLDYNLAARRYDRILTATNAEARFFADRAGIPDGRFSVTPFAADSRFRPIEDLWVLTDARVRLQLPELFILSVSRFHPIKNIEKLIIAYSQAIRDFPRPYKLVLTGTKDGPYYEQMVALVKELELEDNVLFIGWVPPNELLLLYNLASLFVFPLLHENFGIALLEAMSCGLPTITSALPYIEEVVDSAAVKVDPNSESCLAKAMVQVLSCDTTRKRLSKESLRRSQMFSWDQCAASTHEAYDAVARSR